MPSDRELPEGVERKQIRLAEPVHSYIRRLKKEWNADRDEDKDAITISEYLEVYVLPEDPDELDLSHDVSRLKVTPELDAHIDDLVTGRVRKGEIVAYCLLFHAVKQGDWDVVREIVEYIPEILFTEQRHWKND